MIDGARRAVDPCASGCRGSRLVVVAETAGLIVGDNLPAPCKRKASRASTIICESTCALGLHSTAAGRQAFGSLKKFDDAMVAQGKPVPLAMNAGMYHADLSPVGLLVDNGRELSPATGEGAGNFFLKPNGIFLIGRNGTAAVMETSAYVPQARCAFATQSGRCW